MYIVISPVPSLFYVSHVRIHYVHVYSLTLQGCMYCISTIKYRIRNASDVSAESMQKHNTFSPFSMTQSLYCSFPFLHLMFNLSRCVCVCVCRRLLCVSDISLNESVLLLCTVISVLYRLPFPTCLVLCLAVCACVSVYLCF